MDINAINTRKTKLRSALQAVRKLYHDSITAQIVAEPNTPFREIAQQHGVSEQWVIEVARRGGVSRNRYKDDDEVQDTATTEVTHGSL